MSEPVSTLHVVAVGLPLMGIFALAVLAVLTLDTWYPFALVIIFSPLLLCVAIPGMIIAFRLPAADGVAHGLKTLAVVLNGLVLAPFAAMLLWSVGSILFVLGKYVLYLGHEMFKHLSRTG